MGRRCSFRQAKISEWVVVEWVAAALLTTRPLLTKRPLLSECLPALTAVPAALTKQAKRQSKGLHTRASSHCNLLLWRATPLWQLAAVVRTETRPHRRRRDRRRRDRRRRDRRRRDRRDRRRRDRRDRPRRDRPH